MTLVMLITLQKQCNLYIFFECKWIFYFKKKRNAQNAGARAVVFFNDNDRSSLVTARVRGPGWLPGDPLVSIPTLTATYSVGTSILSIQNPLVRLSASTSIKIVETFNVFCETKEGNPQNTIIIGSHLDSVPEGPGINDNVIKKIFFFFSKY